MLQADSSHDFRILKIMMTDPDNRPILAIFYDLENRPHSVFCGTTRYYHEWDFTHCQRDGVVVYHHSGMGPGSGYWNAARRPVKPHWKLWLARGVKLSPAACDGSTPTNCARRFRRGGVKLLRSPIMLPGGHNPFESWNSKEGESEYCGVCQMSLDVTDNNAPCDHLEWCDECGQWTGDGVDYPCIHAGGMARGLAAQDSESPTKLNG